MTGMAAPTTRQDNRRLKAAVFIDVDSIVRSAREMYGIHDALRFQPVPLAASLCAEIGALLTFTYVYVSAPVTGHDLEYRKKALDVFAADTERTSGDFYEKYITKACPELAEVYSAAPRVKTRVIQERVVAKLGVANDSSVMPATRIIDNSDMQVSLATDAMNEMYVDDTTAMVFVTRAPAVTTLVQRLRETAAEERVFKRYYSASLWDVETNRARPSLVNGSDWLYINRTHFLSTFNQGGV